MRSNINKETQSMNKSKSKKVMEYVHLLSTHEEDKVRKTDKKSNLSKNHLQSKSYTNKEFCSNKFHMDKQKYSLNLNHQIKKHVRSKTEYFKPVNLNTYPDEIFDDQPIHSKYEMKKKVMKREESQKKLKSESSKRLHSSNQSRSNLNNAKDKLKPIITKQNPTSIKSSKIQENKTYIVKKLEQPQRKQFSSINQGLQILRQKLKREKSNYSSKQKKAKKTNKISDSKNMTFLNLSQILQRNDFNEEIFIDRENRGSIKNINAGNFYQQNTGNPNEQKLKLIFTHLEQRIDYMTDSISLQTLKKSDLRKNYQQIKQNIDSRSFSFMQNPTINLKQGKSNFSTGEGSIGPDYEIQELLRLKLATQLEINKQISEDLNSIKEIYESEMGSSRPKTARIYELDRGERQKSSARTYKKLEQNQRNRDSSNFHQKSLLLKFLTKYHRITSDILPLIPDINFKKLNEEISPKIRQQKRKSKELQELREQNQKFVSKYNQIAQKNVQYQRLINSLIQNGVNVEKYMHGFFKGKHECKHDA